MFLQTLLQLNILILATPALAGWTLMPPAQPGALRAACVVWQGRSIETVASKPGPVETAQARRVARLQPFFLPPLAIPSMVRAVDPASPFFAAPVSALAPCNHFPHAPRAP